MWHKPVGGEGQWEIFVCLDLSSVISTVLMTQGDVPWVAGACWNGEAACCSPGCRGVLLVCPLFTGKDQFLRGSGGKSDLEWLKLSFVFSISLLNISLWKQRVIEEERLLEHISKIVEN